MDRSELDAKRAQLLRSTGLTYEKLRSGAKEYTLTNKQREAWEGIRTIDYLLGQKKR